MRPQFHASGVREEIAKFMLGEMAEEDWPYCGTPFEKSDELLYWLWLQGFRIVKQLEN